MKIKDMNSAELIDAMILMAKVPMDDSCFTSFNFDSEAWKDKFIELIDESFKRSRE